MNKAKLKMLEKAFVAEIDNTYFISKSKIVNELVEQGYLQRIEYLSHGFGGTIKIIHFRLTILGHYTYCDSCRDIELE